MGDDKTAGMGEVREARWVGGGVRQRRDERVRVEIGGGRRGWGRRW